MRILLQMAIEINYEFWEPKELQNTNVDNINGIVILKIKT